MKFNIIFVIELKIRIFFLKKDFQHVSLDLRLTISETLVHFQSVTKIRPSLYLARQNCKI